MYFNCFFFCRICWPFSFDQPAAAAHVTENLDVAFELFQVRTGQGLKGPVARKNGLAAAAAAASPEGTRHAVGIEIRQTIDLCRSEKGRELRSNAEKLKVKIKNAWEEDGSARQEMRSFLHRYTNTTTWVFVACCYYLSNERDFFFKKTWNIGWGIVIKKKGLDVLEPTTNLVSRQALLQPIEIANNIKY